MKGLLRVLFGLVIPVAVILGYAKWAMNAESFYFPPVDQILEQFTSMWLGEGFARDVWPSIRNLVVGYGLAVALALGIGLAAGLNRRVGAMIMPILHVFRSVPPITLVPPLIIMLGLDWGTKVVVIAIGASLPMVVATIDGLRRIDPETLDTADAYLVRGWLRLRKVTLPAASPTILGGMQVGLQIAFILMVASEMLGAFEGIGYLTIQAQQTFATAQMWAGIVLLSILGVLANFLFGLGRDHLLKWHVGMRAQASAG